MTVQDVFNATNTAKMLIADYKSNNLSHAYMLIGPEGSGKNTLTKAFVKLIMCLNPNGEEPCGECACCKYFDAFGEHPNVTVLTTGNKASIGVGEIREMSEGVFVEPYIGNKKIYIIKNAEKMTQQAQNALLKILEEPPEYVIFFLLASNRYQMLQTVISRSRTLNMSLYSKSALKQLIREEKPDISSTEADALVHRSCGLPGRLLTLLKSDNSYRDYVIETVSALIGNDIEKIFLAAQKADSREAAIEFVSAINEIMRDVSVYAASKNENLLFNTDKTDFIKSVADKAALKQITHFLDETASTLKMLSGNVSYQLCIKNLLMKW